MWTAIPMYPTSVSVGRPLWIPMRILDCVASYFPEFQDAAIKMIKAQGGIFGWVSDSPTLLTALEPARARTA